MLFIMIWQNHRRIFINIFNIWESDMKVCDTKPHIISVNTLKKLVASLSICACLSMLTYADESNDSTDTNGENQNKFVLGIFGGGSLMQMSSNITAQLAPMMIYPAITIKACLGQAMEQSWL